MYVFVFYLFVVLIGGSNSLPLASWLTFTLSCFLSLLYRWWALSGTNWLTPLPAPFLPMSAYVTLCVPHAFISSHIILWYWVGLCRFCRLFSRCTYNQLLYLGEHLNDLWQQNIILSHINPIRFTPVMSACHFSLHVISLPRTCAHSVLYPSPPTPKTPIS